MMPVFELQGHRGARGLKPENTLPGFEIAFDLGLSAVETDVHLTRDGIPLIVHDAVISSRLFRRLPGASVPEPSDQLLVSCLSREECRGYAADRNPDPGRFPCQDAAVTPLADLFCRQEGMDPFTPPTLTEFLRFVKAYAGELGCQAGKSVPQQLRARQLCIDLELKRVPFFPETIGDHFDGKAPGLLEERVVQAVRAAGMVDRAAVRSFDHRAVRAVRRLEPGLTGAVLVEGTAPVSPADLARQAGADVFCPDYHFLDEALVRHAHAAGIRVIPWTVNRPEEWGRLLDWGVDGSTTDFPDQLAAFLTNRGVQF